MGRRMGGSACGPRTTWSDAPFMLSKVHVAARCVVHAGGPKKPARRTRGPPRGARKDLTETRACFGILKGATILKALARPARAQGPLRVQMHSPTCERVSVVQTFVAYARAVHVMPIVARGRRTSRRLGARRRGIARSRRRRWRPRALECRFRERPRVILAVASGGNLRTMPSSY
jgi:hypothetical protein